MGAAISLAAVDDRLRSVARRLRNGDMVPFLGPGLFDSASIPLGPEALAAELGKRVPLPSRLRANAWGAAQFIEQRRHRRTLVQLMSEIFAPSAPVTPFHDALARVAPPLVVNTWYDDAMARSLAGAGVAAARLQGVSRALEHRDVWTRAYDLTGAVLPEEQPLDRFDSILYEPHGSIAPAKNFLIADSDYVEVLTEIDIQSPVPAIVKERRTARAFLFIGCRFHDQMLRTYARQITKRSGGGHVAIVDLATLTRNEARFLSELGAEPVDLRTPLAMTILTEALS